MSTRESGPGDPPRGAPRVLRFKGSSLQGEGDPGPPVRVPVVAAQQQCCVSASCSVCHVTHQPQVWQAGNASRLWFGFQLWRSCNVAGKQQPEPEARRGPRAMETETESPCTKHNPNWHASFQCKPRATPLILPARAGAGA